MGEFEPRLPTDDRLIAAALRCVARCGVTKTTLDDIAREADRSRATVYRAFPGGKDALFEAVVADQISRLSSALHDAVAGADSLEDALVAAITVAAERFEGHAALQFLLSHEPGLVLPHLTFHHLDALLRRASAFGAPLLAPFLGSEDEGAVASEWVARILISYLCSPAAGAHLTDDASVRRLVRTHVLPGLPVPIA